MNEAVSDKLLQRLDTSHETWTIEKTDLTLGKSFNITQRAVTSLNVSMNATFTRPYTGPNTASTPRNPRSLGGFYISDDGGDEFEPAIIQPLHESEDLNMTFQALAASMSNAMRTHSSSTS